MYDIHLISSVALIEELERRDYVVRRDTFRRRLTWNRTMEEDFIKENFMQEAVYKIASQITSDDLRYEERDTPLKKIATCYLEIR